MQVTCIADGLIRAIDTMWTIFVKLMVPALVVVLIMALSVWLGNCISEQNITKAKKAAVEWTREHGIGNVDYISCSDRRYCEVYTTDDDYVVLFCGSRLDSCLISTHWGL